MAVASAGPYASLYLASGGLPCQHPTTQFLQAGCPSCHPTNSVKALKACLQKDVELFSCVNGAMVVVYAVAVVMLPGVSCSFKFYTCHFGCVSVTVKND